MIHYIIRSEQTFVRKDKTTWDDVCYYVSTTTYPLGMHHMTTKPTEAKKFDCRSEAKRVIERVLGNRKLYTIEKVITNELITN